METSPTPKAFFMATWAWFKRNFSNIVLVFIAVFLFGILGHISEIRWDILEMTWSLETIRDSAF